MIYATTRTNSTLKEEIRESLERGEHINIWEERNRWSQNSFPLFRIYAELKSGSKATNLMERSSNYRVIKQDEFEQVTDRTSANELFKRYVVVKAEAKRPKLIILSGYPLSGKTTLAKEIVKLSPENFVHVESDVVREYIAGTLEYESPRYNQTESIRTFNTCWELIRIGLSNYSNVVFDATNLQERGRTGAYEAAEEYNAQVLVIFVESTPEDTNKRFSNADSTRQKAYEHMSETNFTKVTRGYPFITVDSSVSPREMIYQIANKIPPEHIEMKGWVEVWL